MNALQLPTWVLWLYWMFATTEDTSANQPVAPAAEDEGSFDDFTSEWDEPDDEKDKEETKDKEEEKPKQTDTASLLEQKKHWREQAKKLEKEIATLKGAKPAPAGVDDAKEKEARQYLEKMLTDILDERTRLEQAQEEEAMSAMQEELDDLLEEHTQFTEKQVLDTIEEYGVQPAAAVKILLKETELKGKEKPKIPQPKRGKGDVTAPAEKPAKHTSIDSIARMLKDKIRNS